MYIPAAGRKVWVQTQIKIKSTISSVFISVFCVFKALDPYFEDHPSL